MPDVYEKLRERLDMFPQGFPKTKSGVEIDILKHLFSPEEADVSLALRPYPEPVPALAERSGKDQTKLGEMLYDMSRRGLILRFRQSEEEVYYFLAPWMVGIWEFQLNNLNQENIQLYERFYREGMAPSRKGFEVGGFRVIPIEEELKGSTEIQPYEKISEIIESNTRFAVADCICRKESRILGHGCDKLLEACMMFGLAAEYYIENELGREISKEEAREILLKAEESGLVHFSSNHADDKIFICNCCGCCCKALANITKYDNPGVIAKSNYYALVDPESCTGCEACVDRCQVNAVEMADDLAKISVEKCIGCGLCVSTCPGESISMYHKQPEDLSAVFSDQNDLMQALAKQASKEFPFE